MDNASEALIMAGSILIAVIVISISVFIFNSFSTFSKEREEELFRYQLSEFNSNFTKYESDEYKDDITLHEVISLANFAKNYNESLSEEEKAEIGGISIKVMVEVKPGDSKTDLAKKSQAELNDILNKYFGDDGKVPVYTCSSIEYNNSTGTIKTITFTSKYK